jgi:hypothetical protein
MSGLVLTTLPGRFAVCLLESGAALPSWVGGSFVSITRTSEELSIICDEASVPADVRAERGWTCMQLLGPIAFETTGVAAAIATPLADAGISVLIVATFDTDYVLVREEAAYAARAALERAGFVWGADVSSA